MGSLVAAMASSHALAVAPPEMWDELRERNRKVSAQRRNIAVPPAHPRLSEESWEDVQTRYGRVRKGLLDRGRRGAGPGACLRAALSRSGIAVVQWPLSAPAG